jgi:hypothetical protein
MGSRGRAIIGALVGMSLLLAGCGARAAGGGAASPVVSMAASPAPTSEPASTAAEDVAGTWNGAWIAPDGVHGTIEMRLSMSGATMVGTITVSNACFDHGSVLANVDGRRIELGVVSGSTTIDFTGSVAGDRTSGQFQSKQCGSGMWSASR